MNKILIVGGGTSGFVSALILKKRFPKLIIDIVKSDKIGIIGVGEGTTEHWLEFINFCGIDYKELINECDATLKYGVMFEDWTKHKYFHNITGYLMSIKYGQYLGGYAYSVINNLKPEEYTSNFVFKNKVAKNDLSNQFHFNTFKLNCFLEKKCKEAKIKIFEDEIVNVVTKNNKITNIKSKNKNYKYDFYIDSTGFKKLLISKLGAKWISYSEYLPMNEAIAFPLEDTEEYSPYTLARAMSSGWLWRIPTQGRWGNGYVYNNNYMTPEKAQKECEEYFIKNNIKFNKIEIFKNIKFDAGALDKPWINNCLAIGLSASFVEPLEATSIGTSIQQSFLLIHLINNYTKEDIDLYNEKFKNIVENIRDFIVLHYMVSKKDSKFWKDLKLKIPHTLEINLKKWRNRLPINEDFNGNYNLFNSHNFTVILKELGLLNKDAIKKEYDLLNNSIKENIEHRVNSHISHNFFNENLISHKEFLKEFK